MPPRRRPVLVALLAVVALVTALLLGRILATVFFAVTVAYVLVPLHRWLRRRGVPGWWASAVATAAAFVGALAIFLPIVAVLYVRRGVLLELLSSLPDEVRIEVAGYLYVADVGELTGLLGTYLTRFAIDVARATPELAAHATVFAFVVFALLADRERVRRALLLPTPDDYHDVAQALHERIQGTLFALYVIQVATSMGTFVVAAVLFWALGYDSPFTLGVIAGVLQFLPVVGPSLLVIGIAAYEVSVGAYSAAALVLVLGLPLVGLLPDVVIRPRLARDTAKLPASLYFVGFTGGILTLGPIGVIAGPLVVAVLAEVLALLAAEKNSRVAE